MSAIVLSLALIAHAGIDCAQAERVAAARKPVDAYLRGDVLPGIVIAASSTRVSARDGGRVAEVLVAPGDEVSAGAALLRLENVELTRELARIEPDSAVLRSQIGEQTAEVDRLEREGARREAHPQLFAREDREAHAATLTAARARLDAARARLTAMALRHGQLVQQLDTLMIRAPIAGRVQNLRVRAGESLQAGAALADINGDGSRRVRFAVPAAALARVKPGAEVCVRVERASLNLDAAVIRLDQAFDPGAQAVFAEAEFAARDAAVLPGMAVDVLPRSAAP